MSKQAIRISRQANNYVAPTIEKYVKRRFRIVAGLGALALIAGLSGCPSREEVKKLPAQIVDGGRMSDGSQQAAVKPPEKKDVGLSSIVPKKEGEKDLSKPVWIDKNTLRFPDGKIVEVGKTSDLPSLGTRNPEPVKQKTHERIH